MKGLTRTTVDLPDELLVAAKKKAAELRRPLRQLIEAGLRSQLRQARTTKAKKRRIRWTVVDGGLPRGLDVSNRESLAEWLRRERS